MHKNLTELELDELPDRRRCSPSEPWCCCPVVVSLVVTPAAVVAAAPVPAATPAGGASVGYSAMLPVTLSLYWGAVLATPVMCMGLPNSSLSWTGFPYASVRWIGFPRSSFKSAILLTILLLPKLIRFLGNTISLRSNNKCIYYINMLASAWLWSTCRFVWDVLPREDWGRVPHVICLFWTNTSRIRHNNDLFFDKLDRATLSPTEFCMDRCIGFRWRTWSR